MRSETPVATAASGRRRGPGPGLISGLGLLTGVTALLVAGGVSAQDASPAAEVVQAAAEAAPPAAVMDKGDVAWMMTATVLVTMMVIPGLALFYGGLVRAKNMLSVLTQVFAIFCVACLVWMLWGYSLAFTDGPYNAIVGGLDRVFLQGITMDSMAATFTAGVVIPEFVFISFQMTFAAITCALIVGAFAERIKFGPLLLFSVLWITIVYAPIAHMVWWSGGYLYDKGAFDFAGGTVVHINSGIAALVGALYLGRRLGYGREIMAPHSLPLTLVGAALLWVGWFGFNAGSNLEATGGAALAMITTFAATAAAALAWQFAEWLTHGKPSLLGLASGAIAGLVAITPACGFAGPMGAIVLGLVAGVICFVFCTTVKNALGYDDSLDVFGIHGIGGIIGALGTAVVAAGAFGGIKTDADYSIMAQLLIQAEGVLITIAWSGIGTLLIFMLLGVIFGLRVTEEKEREGLDISEHGERAYNI